MIFYSTFHKISLGSKLKIKMTSDNVSLTKIMKINARYIKCNKKEIKNIKQIWILKVY